LIRIKVPAPGLHDPSHLRYDDEVHHEHRGNSLFGVGRVRWGGFRSNPRLLFQKL